MKIHKKQQGFGAIEALLLLVIVGLLAFVGWYVWHSKNNADSSYNNASNVQTNSASANKTPKNPYMHTAQEAVAFTQKTYNTYLAALIQGNQYNTAHPSSSNQTLQQIGLVAVKDNLNPLLYSKINANQSQGGLPNEFGCVKYQPDKYTSSLKTVDKTSATINVAIIGSGGNNQGDINVGVDLSSLKITSVTCPN